MTRVRVVILTLAAVVVGSQPLVAQDLLRYREYALASSVASVAKISGVREAEARTLTARPAKIQDLEWLAPYVQAGTNMADPVRDVMFSFVDDQLYRVLVTYDSSRVKGLTSVDVVESVSSAYGVSPLEARMAPRFSVSDAAGDVIVVAQWDDAGSVLTLTRGVYTDQFQLVLISKRLNARAADAIKEALRLDTQEAPQHERDQRSQEAADTKIATERARVVNKAAFRP